MVQVRVYPDGGAPTAKMLAYARSLASNRNLARPPGYDQDFAICRQFS